ncbi:11063_t:CDS:1, partial [Acaulospora colombiana]
MNSNRSDVSMYTRRGILAADQPLVVPMLLRLSNLKLRGIIVLVVSKQKGITMVFKNDPLEKVDVASTFDSISSIQRFLQTEIEKRLRIMFQEDLPSIVHQLSLQKWLNGGDAGKKDDGTQSKESSSDHRPPHVFPDSTPYDT